MGDTSYRFVLQRRFAILSELCHNEMQGAMAWCSTARAGNIEPVVFGRENWDLPQGGQSAGMRLVGLSNENGTLLEVNHG
jgi:hypothetical protein